MSRESNPLVTIGIPTYNRGDRYLRQAVQSGLAQTYPNLEIVVSDNASYTFIMTAADIQLTAVFELISYALWVVIIFASSSTMLTFEPSR